MTTYGRRFEDDLSFEGSEHKTYSATGDKTYEVLSDVTKNGALIVAKGTTITGQIVGGLLSYGGTLIPDFQLKEVAAASTGGIGGTINSWLDTLSKAGGVIGTIRTGLGIGTPPGTGTGGGTDGGGTPTSKKGMPVWGWALIGVGVITLAAILYKVTGSSDAKPAKK